MSFRQTTVSGLPAIALGGEALEVVAIPALGVKLAHLRRPRGREWLWRSDQIPLAEAQPGAAYAETADSGGWDECFPTVGPSPLPGAPPGTPPLPDHGELWSARWESAIYEHAEGTTLTSTMRGERLPYEFHREVTVDPRRPLARLRYRLRHLGEAPFPWLWSSHPVLNVQPGSVLEVPGMTQVRLDAVHGRTDVARDDIVSWPGALGGSADGFRFPDEGAGWAAKLFGDVGAAGVARLTDPRRGERLELRVRPDEVPQVGIWINARGWAPAGRTPYYNLALEPCIGAPDRLDDAVERWGAANTLVPGEERRWSVDVWALEEGEHADGAS